jgi:hypothetical protein
MLIVVASLVAARSRRRGRRLKPQEALVAGICLCIDRN